MTESIAAVEAGTPAAPRRTTRHVHARRHRARVAGRSAIVIVLVCLLASLAPRVAHVAGHGPNDQDLIHGLTRDGLPRPPSSTYLLGTDDLGRDVLVRIAYGARISLLVGLVATGLAIVAGVVIGLLAGIFGGLVGLLLGRLMD